MIERYEGDVKLVFNTTDELLEYEKKKSMPVVRASDFTMKEEETVKVDNRKRPKDGELLKVHWGSGKVNHYVFGGNMKRVYELWGTMSVAKIVKETGLSSYTVQNYSRILQRAGYL